MDRIWSRVNGESPLVHKFSQCLNLEEEDCRQLARFEAASRSMGAREDIVVEGEPYGQAAVLLEGWCIRYKLLPDGRRQVVDFVLPGCFIGLHAHIFEVADHSVSTLTPCRLSFFDPQLVAETFAERPRLGGALVWDNACREALLMERVASLGRRSAYEGLAHLLVETCKRLQWCGGLMPGDNRLPISQTVIADTLGLSLVHVSRTISKMRSDGLIEDGTRRGIAVRDLDGLMQVCGYDETYLHREHLPARRRSRMGAETNLRVRPLIVGLGGGGSPPRPVPP